MIICDYFSENEIQALDSIGLHIESKEYSYNMIIELLERMMGNTVSAMNQGFDKSLLSDVNCLLSDKIYELISIELLNSGKGDILYKRPAIVKCIDSSVLTESFYRVHLNKYYLAYFIEYWETTRDNLYIKDETGNIKY